MMIPSLFLAKSFFFRWLKSIWKNELYFLYRLRESSGQKTGYKFGFLDVKNPSKVYLYFSVAFLVQKLWLKQFSQLPYTRALGFKPRWKRLPSDWIFSIQEFIIDLILFSTIWSTLNLHCIFLFLQNSYQNVLIGSFQKLVVPVRLPLLRG